jgi:2,3-bisphosphoglycerate-dependent phosphoglycerate mutase
MEDVPGQHRAAPDETRGGAVRIAPRRTRGGRALPVALALLLLGTTPPPPAARAETTVFVVRHAEKVDSSTDAELDGAGRERARLLRDMLRDLPVETFYASKYRRTQQTVAPAAEARELPLTIHETAAIDSLAGALRAAAKDSIDRYVVVAGHSNTVIQWLTGLGISSVAELLDHEYDNLFVVTLGDENRSRLLRLRFGY